MDKSTRTILRSTLNYLEDQIEKAREAFEHGNLKELNELAFDIYSESEKLYDQTQGAR